MTLEHVSKYRKQTLKTKIETLQFSLVLQHFPTILQFFKDLKEKRFGSNLVFCIKKIIERQLSHRGGEAREAAELTTFPLGFSVRLVNRKSPGSDVTFSCLMLMRRAQRHMLQPPKRSSTGIYSPNADLQVLSFKGRGGRFSTTEPQKGHREMRTSAVSPGREIQDGK